MSRTATLTAMGHELLVVGHHWHRNHLDGARRHEATRPAKPVVAAADRADAVPTGATARRGALDLLLFSFAVGSGWGPAQSWRHATRDADSPQARVR